MCHGKVGNSLRRTPGGDEFGPIGDDTSDTSDTDDDETGAVTSSLGGGVASEESAVAERALLLVVLLVESSTALTLALDDCISEPPRINSGLDNDNDTVEDGDGWILIRKLRGGFVPKEEAPERENENRTNHRRRRSGCFWWW